MERVKLITLIIFLSLGINAQTFKSITPTKGEIIFSEVSKITDRKLFEESLKSFKEKFKKSLSKSLDKNKSNTEVANLDEMLSATSDILEPTLFSEESYKTYHYEFNGFIITRYASTDDEIKGDYQIIDTKTGSMSYFSQMDSTAIYDQRQYLYSDNIILSISENKEQRKSIHGYDCYRVTYLYKENIDNKDDYFLFAGDIIYKREMWVTPTINLLYHPIVKEKQILEKYYPLEILETQNDVKGFQRKYLLEKITIQ